MPPLNTKTRKGPDILENDAIRLFDHLIAITRDGSQLDRIQRKVKQFILSLGRRPRILVSQTEPGAPKQPLNRLGSILAQWGFDVDIGPLEKSPDQTARMALENDVHMVVLLGSKNMLHRASTELIDALKVQDARNILVAVFGAATACAKAGDGRPQRIGTSDLIVFNPKSANDVIVMLDKLVRKY